uniref:N-acetyltransferase domain-containing protein n=1 Tax=Proboscia inermis TaxID=420281 RepID=A0A7S0CDT4_9STRA
MSQDFKVQNNDLEIHNGAHIALDQALSDDIADILRVCFPEMIGLSTPNVLLEGIGFHDLKDTWWLLKKYRSSSRDSSNTLVGLITAVVYHNGLYLCNFCVSPDFQGRGMGLDILEDASLFAVQRNQTNLIGHAASEKVLKYYSKLGAEVMNTGMGRKDGPICTSVRLQRKIPNTQDNVGVFFASLRRRRMIRRRHRLAAFVLIGALGSIVAASFFRLKANRNSLKQQK